MTSIPTLNDELRQKVETGQAVVVVGAGVSIGATASAETTSWTGLISHGAQFAISRREGQLPSRWQTSVASDIAMAIEDGYADGLIAAAQKITTALGGAGSADFRDWLRLAFEALDAKNTSVIDAIVELKLPILTTNYDTLIEQVTGFTSVTWKNLVSRSSALTSDSKSVVHLHGMWNEPETVVLGYDGYERVVGAEGPQILQKSVGLTRSYIFIGCGQGLNDINFGGLRRWLADVGASSDVRHYVLCREDDARSLAEEFKDEKFVPVPFGPKHEDLPAYLSTLKKKSDIELVRARKEANAPVAAIEELTERIKRETILGEHMADLDTRDALDVLIPPVLLPVSQQDYARAASGPAHDRYERCDAQADLDSPNVIVLVGDENSGLTSGLEWLAAAHFKSHPQIVPVMIAWSDLQSGKSPVEAAAHRYLRTAGALHDKQSPLVPYLVALDDVNSRPANSLRRAIEDIAKQTCAKALLGCRPGVEVDIAEQLDEHKVPYIIRYVGRLTHRDATQLASLVAPTEARADQLSSRALEIIRAEHLPRTPFTVSLLVSALMFGEDTIQARSGTALLDAYVNLLLGRGDVGEDARVSIDSVDRLSILASLAKEYFDEEQGSLAESAVVNFFESYFASRDWTENAGDFLSNLRARRILNVRNSKVSFSQSSYLYLFAAHMASRDVDFKRRLAERPVYFSPVLRHYAALTRHDTELLETLDDLLGNDDNINPSHSRIFTGAVMENESTEDSDVEELFAIFSAPELGSTSAESSIEDDPLDHLPDVDRNPFPLDRVGEAPPYVQLGNALSLVSAVLRDSDSITDLTLKRKVLGKLLVRWGLMAEFLNEDPKFLEFCAELHKAVFIEMPRKGGQSSSESGAPSVSPEMVMDLPEFEDLFCTLVPVSGLSLNLSSRKLTKSLHHLVENENLELDPRAAAMGAYLLLDMQEPGWAGHFARLLEPHLGRGSFSTFIWRTAFNLWNQSRPMTSADERALRDFLVRATIKSQGFRDTPGVRAKVAANLQRVRTDRQSGLPMRTVR